MGTRQAEVLYPRSRCAPEELDCWITTSGPTRHLPPGLAPFWLVVPRRTWVALVCATQRRVVLCRYSEHCPNVGHLSILRKCLVRPLSPKRDGGGHTSENRGVETYAYMHITYILPNASRQRVSRSTILSKNVKSSKDGSVTLNSPTKGRVEVVQLNFCDTTINWKYPFLTGPERGFESDSCK